jgi:hypothetical protein
MEIWEYPKSPVDGRVLGFKRVMDRDMVERDLLFDVSSFDVKNSTCVEGRNQ